MTTNINVHSYAIGKKHLGKLYITKRQDIIVICNRNARPSDEHFHGTVIASTNAFYHVGQHITDILNDDRWMPFDGVIDINQ